VKFNDSISGAFFIVCAVAIFLLTRGFTVMHGQAYSAAFFPRSIAVIMALLGATLVVQGLRQRGAQPWVETLDWMRSSRHIANFALVIGSLVFYILVSDALGFVITASLVLFALLYWLRGRPYWLSSLVIAFVSTLVLQQFFGQFLRVPLPWGILQAYAW
jgi:putative tricarboxylic transport membrane protein